MTSPNDRQVLSSTSNQLKWIEMSKHYQDEDTLAEFYEDEYDPGEYPVPYYSVVLYKVRSEDTSYHALVPNMTYCYRLDIDVCQPVPGWETGRPLSIELFSSTPICAWLSVQGILSQYLEPFRAKIEEFTGNFHAPNYQDVECEQVVAFMEAVSPACFKVESPNFISTRQALRDYDLWKHAYYNTAKFAEYAVGDQYDGFWEYGQDIMLSEWLNKLKS
jgi:hypothetical protein